MRTTRRGLGLPDRRGSKKGQDTQKAFVPTEKQREYVALNAAYGKSQEWIGKHMPGGEVSEDTVVRHFRKELDDGVEYANAELGGVLFAEARKGNVRALEQWFDRRGGSKWKRKVTQEHSGPDGGPIRYTDLTDDELDAKLEAFAKAAGEDNGDDTEEPDA